jgi:hypothetical protein
MECRQEVLGDLIGVSDKAREYDSFEDALIGLGDVEYLVTAFYTDTQKLSCEVARAYCAGMAKFTLNEVKKTKALIQKEMLNKENYINEAVCLARQLDSIAKHT